MRRIILILLPLLLLVAVLAFLGGSVVWYLLGGSPLDIDGRSEKVNAVQMPDGWRHYGGDAGGNRFSNAAQITTQNVETLEIAWVHKTGDMEKRADMMDRTAAEATPILLDGRLTFCTPFNEVIAIDPGSGVELWRFDPELKVEWPANQFVCDW